MCIKAWHEIAMLGIPCVSKPTLIGYSGKWLKPYLKEGSEISAQYWAYADFEKELSNASYESRRQHKARCDPQNRQKQGGLFRCFNKAGSKKPEPGSGEDIRGVALPAHDKLAPITNYRVPTPDHSLPTKGQWILKPDHLVPTHLDADFFAEGFTPLKFETTSVGEPTSSSSDSPIRPPRETSLTARMPCVPPKERRVSFTPACHFLYFDHTSNPDSKLRPTPRRTSRRTPPRT